MSLTPLIIFKDIFPDTIIDKIQSYIKNDLIYDCMLNYYYILQEKKELYNNFVIANYIEPLCYCRNFPENGVRKIFRKKECSPCCEYECVYEDSYPKHNYRIIHR